MSVALHANRGVAAEAAGHADSFAHEAGGIASGSLRGDAEHALNGRRDAQAEAGEESRQGAAGDEGHDDDEEDLPGVALSPMDEVAEEALELFVCLLDKALARGAFVVRGSAWLDWLVCLFRLEGHSEGERGLTVSKEAGAAVVAAAQAKE